MISEEDIHRYHITERVYGPPLSPFQTTYESIDASKKGRKRAHDGERVRIELSISPPSSATSSVKYTSGSVDVIEKVKKVKGKGKGKDVGRAGISNERGVEEVGEKKEKRLKKDKKDKPLDTGKEKVKGMGKDKDQGKGKEKETGGTHQGPLTIKAPDEGTTIPAATAPISNKDLNGKKRKREKVKPITKAGPPKQIPLPLPPSSTQMEEDELDSDEQDIFEIDELLPSSPIHHHHHSPPIPSTSQIISQVTPTPKSRPKKKQRVSDSSGFDIPSAPPYLRDPSNTISTSALMPSRLGMGIKGTPVVQKALVRLGASWVTSTPVPK